MRKSDPKQRVAILRILRDNEAALSSSAVAREMGNYGFEPSPRTVRLYLKEMEAEGLVAQASRGRNGGRRITPRGVEEIKDAFVAGRVGFITARVETLAWQMTFDAVAGEGLIVLNITTISAGYLSAALRAMVPVFEAGLGMGSYLALAREGERLGKVRVPPGKAAIGSICSVTVNGALLAARIPVVSRFGGVLEMRERRPARFTDVICYDGTTLDPLEIFIKARVTSVGEAARTGHGRIGASFREVPTPAMPDVAKTLKRLERIGLKSVICVGKPNQPLLGFPVHEGMTGLVLPGGLNPAAAVEEAGIPTESAALSTLFPFEKLISYKEVKE